MQVVGLTAGVAMGKNYVSKQFQKLGAPVFDADREVHKLIAVGGSAVDEIAQVLPESVIFNTEGQKYIDKWKLAKLTLEDEKKFQQVENIIYPLAKAQAEKFIDEHGQKGTNMVILKVSLLFEARWNEICDKTIVIFAPRGIQESRYFSRKWATREKFEIVRAHQMSNESKINSADFIIYSGFFKWINKWQVKIIYKKLRKER